MPQATLGRGEFVDRNHEGADHGVECVSVEVVSHFRNGLVDDSKGLLRSFFGHRTVGEGLGVQALRLAQEVVDPADALGVPGFVLGEWPQEHFVTAQGVGAVALDQIVRRLHVVLRLGHLLDLVAAEVGTVVFQDELCLGVFRPPGAEPFEVQLVVVHEVDVHMEPLGGVGFALAGRHKGVGALDAVHEAGPSQDHPLVDHAFERFIEADVSPVVQEFGPKTCVQQVPGGVLGPADVQVHLAPVIAFVAGAKLRLVVGVHVTQEVPAASRPTGHRVGLHGVALEHRPVLLCGARQRRFAVFGGQVRVHFGERHGGVGDALGHALLVLDGEGFTPVSLTAEDRVSDAVVDGPRAHALFFHPIDGQRDGVGGFHAVPFAAATEDGPLVGAHGFLRVDPFKNGRDVEPKVRGKFPVSFVAGRHRHDGARAVPGQDVIGDPHRNQGA